jgi:hypothetical protein
MYGLVFVGTRSDLPEVHGDVVDWSASEEQDNVVVDLLQAKSRWTRSGDSFAIRPYV